MSTFRNIPIDLIAPNPHRNFDIFPINDEQVEMLMDSYAEAGDFGVIPVRPSTSDYEDGYTFEQAAGHHRVEAMHQLGCKTVPCVVSSFDEDMMITIMINENMTQAGTNVAARLDSVAAIIKRIAEVILSLGIEQRPTNLNDADKNAWSKKQDKKITTEVSDMVESFVVLTAEQLKQAHSAILSGKGFSNTLIKLYKPDTFGPTSAIAESVAQLRDTGNLSLILNDVAEEMQLKIEAEREEAEELKAKREAERVRQAKAEQKAIKNAEKARKEMLAAQKRQKEAVDKATRIRAKREAAEAKENARNAEANARALVKTQAALKVKEDARKAREESQRRTVIAARIAATAAKEASKGLHPDVLTLLTNAAQVEAFRTYVTKSPNIFPESQHPELIVRMKKELSYIGEEVTKRSISKFLQNEFAKKDAVFRKLQEQRLAADESMNIILAVDNAIAGVRTKAADFSKACVKLDKVLNDPRQGERAYRDVMNDNVLLHQLEKASKTLLTILDGLKVQTRIRTIDTDDFIEGEMV